MNDSSKRNLSESAHWSQYRLNGCLIESIEQNRHVALTSTGRTLCITTPEEVILYNIREKVSSLPGNKLDEILSQVVTRFLSSNDILKFAKLLINAISIDKTKEFKISLPSLLEDITNQLTNLMLSSPHIEHLLNWILWWTEICVKYKKSLNINRKTNNREVFSNLLMDIKMDLKNLCVTNIYSLKTLLLSGI